MFLRDLDGYAEYLLAVLTGLGGMIMARVGDELVSNPDDQRRGKGG